MPEPSLLTLGIGAASGGLAGAVVTLFFNTRTRYWSRYFELQKLVIENPFLYPIWDQAGNPDKSDLSSKWASSYSEWTSAKDYMDSLVNDKQKAKVLTFIEAWGDFILESKNLLYFSFLGRFNSGFTDRAKEICILYDLFPANKKLRQKIIKTVFKVPNGRNGIVYGKTSQKKLELLD